jgi:O-antigen chain-terminating methyltransferase
VDRCEAIHKAIGNASGMRILDVGSSLGYVSFYFADRGAMMEGWDSNNKNVEISQLISELNGISAVFKVVLFNRKSVNSFKKGDFDIVIMLSVLHHVTKNQGLNTTKKLIKHLVDVVPMLIVELARKGENPGKWKWDKSQPENELEIFDLVKDYVIIEKIGEFSRFVGKTRPIYIILKKNV